MKEDSIVECKITKIGRVYITINNGYPNRQFFIKSGNDYEFGIQEKENAIDGGILNNLVLIDPSVRCKVSHFIYNCFFYS